MDSLTESSLRNMSGSSAGWGGKILFRNIRNFMGINNYTIMEGIWNHWLELRTDIFFDSIILLSGKFYPTDILTVERLVIAAFFCIKKRKEKKEKRKKLDIIRCPPLGSCWIFCMVSMQWNIIQLWKRNSGNLEAQIQKHSQMKMSKLWRMQGVLCFYGEAKIVFVYLYRCCNWGWKWPFHYVYSLSFIFFLTCENVIY